ncbi:MAG: DUF616 domain-containing protein [Paludibacteraceae bacterium]|nr:DUF616 domain-containing protein [Paludibacteraceae bacterium]
MNKTIIYTVITGNYDTIKQPLVLTPGADYFLFTNNPYIIEAGVWKVVHIPSLNIGSRSEKENNILLSRRVKMLAHEYLPQGYDVSVYVDADMLLKESLSELLDTIADNRLMAACRHSYCASVKEEIDDLLDKCMVDALQIENQWQRYVEWGFKDNVGISENGLLIRRHNEPSVIELMELWWEEYQQGCLRDQVSLMPCIYRTGFMPYFQFIEMDIRKNNMLKVLRHKEYGQGDKE